MASALNQAHRKRNSKGKGNTRVALNVRLLEVLTAAGAPWGRYRKYFGNARRGLVVKSTG